jgi:uncharacterized protein (DUF58 family)
MGCAALALVAASLVSAAFSLWGIDLQRGACGDAACGEAVSLPLGVRNRLSRRRQPVVVVEDVPFAADPCVRTVIPPLRGGEERGVQRRVLALKRGEFVLGRVLLRGGDPAGLFRRERWFVLPARMVVYPGTEPIPDLLLHQSEALGSVAGSPVSAAGVSQDFYGVREYHPTDGLRYIHWRSSARFGHLMVREFERNAVVSVAVMLDAHEHFVSGSDPCSNLEYQVRAAASICRHCADLYCSFGFAAAGAAPVVVRPALASAVCAEVMYALATLRPGPVTLAAAAGELARQLPRNTVVFCFSLAAPRDLADALGLLTEQGMQVRWYCARRDVFGAATGGRGHHRPVTLEPAPRWLLAPTELLPGMGLEEALKLHAS